jgi:hypothetical protein
MGDDTTTSRGLSAAIFSGALAPYGAIGFFLGVRALARSGSFLVRSRRRQRVPADAIFQNACRQFSNRAG